MNDTTTQNSDSGSAATDSESAGGLRKLFTAFDIRGTAASGLTRQTAWVIGMAIAEFLQTDGSILLVENSSSGVAECLSEGIRLQGRAVIRGQNIDRESFISLITPDLSGVHQYSGGLTISRDSSTDETTIELVNHVGHLIGHETGLLRICELAEAGHFTPDDQKATETQLA